MSSKFGLQRSGGMTKSSSAIKLDTIREVHLSKKHGETFGCELIEVGKRVFVTLVRSTETGTAFQSADAAMLRVHTPAYRAGLRFGDEILRINGTDAHSLTIVQIYDAITFATEVELDYCTAAMQIDFAVTVYPGQELGIELGHGNRVVSVVSGSAADMAGLMGDSSIIAINEKSLVGLSIQQVAATIMKEAKPARGKAALFTLTVMPHQLYSPLSAALVDAIKTLGITCSPSYLLDNDSQIQPAATTALASVAPRVASAATVPDCPRSRSKRGGSVSSYFNVDIPSGVQAAIRQQSLAGSPV